MTPAWILDTFAALMLAVAAVSAARLAAARLGRAVLADTDAAHLLMAIAMAGMLAPGLAPLPGTAWDVVFGLQTGWFGFRVARDVRATGVGALAGGHRAPHLAHSAAMLYMFMAVAAPAAGGPGPGSMGGPAMRTLGYPTLAFVFALILAGYSIWDLDRLSGGRYSLAGRRVALAGVPATGNCPVTSSGSAPAMDVLSPASTVGCRIVMGITMALMLLIMI
jgi:uncharacterized protein DUF5134